MILFFKGILYYTIISGTDLLRIWVGPLPNFACFVLACLRSVLFVQTLMILCALTVIKFVFLCVLKRVPDMDDDLAAKWVLRSIMTLSFGLSAIKYSGETRPNKNEVTFSLFANLICSTLQIPNSI